MKRSRTCLNLVELDAPVAPKRTCSLPSNLATFTSSSSSSSSSSRSSSSSSGGLRQSQESLQFFRKRAPSTVARGPALAALAGGAFVVDSIVCSQGSLNEITIHEGQQFVGRESETAVPQSSLPSFVQSSQPQLALFGGAVIGSLFEDGCDSSDYFCGVDSSDEAEVESNSNGIAASAVGGSPSISDDNDSTDGGADVARQVSDADSAASLVRQVSDASSSGMDGGGNVSEGEEAEDDTILGAYDDAFAHGAAAGLSLSLPAAPARPWGQPLVGGYCNDACTIVVPPGGGPHSGGSWRPATALGPRVSVRVSSPSGSARMGSPLDRVMNSRQRSMTVPPPWPLPLVPPSAVMSGWRDEPITRGGNATTTWQQQRQHHPRGQQFRAGSEDGDDEEDGSLISAAGFGVTDDSKMLMGMDRLRLVNVEPEAASS